MLTVGTLPPSPAAAAALFHVYTQVAVTNIPTPFLLVSNLPGDVTHHEVLKNFGTNSDVKDNIVLEPAGAGGGKRGSGRSWRGGGNNGSGYGGATTMLALLSYRSGSGAGKNKEAWDGVTFRPKPVGFVLISVCVFVCGRGGWCPTFVCDRQNQNVLSCAVELLLQ